MVPQTSCFRGMRPVSGPEPACTRTGFSLLTLRFNGVTRAIMEIYTRGPATSGADASLHGVHGASFDNNTRVKKMNHTRIILIGSLCMICLVAAVMPVAASPVGGNAWNTNPEHITAMQAFVAYAGAKGQAQMDGAISYIGTISNGAGTAPLSAIESQFTGTVTSVQSMTTGEEIQQAESQLKSDRTNFMSTAKSSLQEYNGTGKALEQNINASVMAQSATLQGLENTWWTDRQTARMDLFATNDQRREGVLSNLTAKGIDVSQAQAVENQIQQEGTVLNAALTSRDESAIKAANEDLATLNQQFASIIKTYRAEHRIRVTPTTTITPVATL